MNIIDIITKKKNKEELSQEEIKYVVSKFMSNRITDYQMSALLMAITINGLTFDETYYLTESMINSGEKLDLSTIKETIVDKHSTGGVGDKTSLVVLPIVASCGVKIAKLSGRGLGFTGGTIDKLESISGFKTNIRVKDFINQVNKINLSLISQTNNLVPADKKIYSLRDVTGTTESIGLIASSIMSKKISSSSDKILLDVKLGKGSFMKNIKDAEKLANTMVKIGKKFNKETIALITNMTYPLGRTVGNGLEVKEAIETLLNKGEENFTKLCIILSTYMVSMGKNIDVDKASDEVINNLKNGSAFKKFKEFVECQGGDLKQIEICPRKLKVRAKENGYITDIDTMGLALLSRDLGAGRKKKTDTINHGVGLELNKTICDKVKVGEVIMTVYTEKDIDVNELSKYFTIKGRNIAKPVIVYEVKK